MVTVQLRQLLMTAYHGVYEHEHRAGNNYEVNLDVIYDEKEADFDTIGDTINYVDLFNIVKKRMEVPAKLLEKVCDEIIAGIRKDFPQVREVTISMFKLQPPIENMQGRVGITMTKKFDD